MSDNTDILQRGDKIGCYRIEQVLGRGGFAVTYLATDENLDVEVAIKEYLPREITQRDDQLQVSARKPEFTEDYKIGLENFAREAKTLARFKHPHIVRVHQVLHANNTAYMVMEFEHGQELGELIEKNQSLTEDELRSILFPILDGVEEIHRHGFVHRDIKPSNIYIRHNGSPVLIDFGAARYTMSETTQQLTAVVTVGYTPIEQYNVSEDAQGPWSDIYALAAVCYEAVTGEVPADSVTRASASVTQGDDPLPSVRQQIKSDYSDDCLDAIDWGLRMEAEDRPQMIAQWRDSFDGIFNPASAYTTQKDVSIYSPHRVDKPLQSRSSSDIHAARSTDNLTREQAPSDRSSGSSADDIVSVPLRATDTTLDNGVVSLDRDPVSTTIPPVPRSTHDDREHTADNTRLQSNRDTSGHSAGDVASPGALHSETDNNVGRQPPPLQKPRRSKLERPSHLSEPAPKKARRVIREEITLNDSDWDDSEWYEPPKRSSALKLLLPVLGLAAVVGSSVMLVNSPDLITSIFNKDPDLTSEQALDLAQIKVETENYVFPEGDSALDYYQLALEEDPDNPVALAGMRSIESLVRQQITDNMQNNNVAEANRILARADSAGLSGVYNASTNTPDASANGQTSETPDTPTIPIVSTSDDTIVTPVDTTSPEPISTTTEAPSNQTEQALQTATVIPTPTTSTNNSTPPFIEGQLAELDTLIQQQRFTEARALFGRIDTFIPDQSRSNQLLQRIEAGEADAAAEAARQNELLTTNTTPAPSTNTSVSEEETTTAASSVSISPTDPPRNSYIDANGTAANHLNRLRLALEAKDIEAVQALSQPLPEGRIRFLNSTFARHHRLDVVIDNVTVSDDTISGRLNVAMFGRGDDGSVYSAGKWNGAIIEAVRENGSWQKIRW